MNIQLDPKVPPKQTPCRPVPIHLKDTFKQEIDRMLKAGVLKLVQEANPWINSFVFIEKYRYTWETQTLYMPRSNQFKQGNN